MPTVSVSSDAYQDLEAIRERVNYDGRELFDEQNYQLEFDELLVRLEKESRGIFETLWGDQTPLEQTARVDTRRAPYDTATPLVYPIQDVTQVEIKRTRASDWDTLNGDYYDWTEHRLILESRPNVNALRYRQGYGANRLTNAATRPTWRDVCVKFRVTYDRGFAGGAPDDVKSIQIQIINNMLRQLRREQTVAAASPEEFAGQTETEEVVTQEIRDRISDVTSPGRATQSF